MEAFKILYKFIIRNPRLILILIVILGISIIIISPLSSQILNIKNPFISYIRRLSNKPNTKINQNPIHQDSINLNTVLVPINNRIYLGAFPDFGGTEDHLSLFAIQQFETIIKRPIAYAYFSVNWPNINQITTSDLKLFKQAKVTPFIRLMPPSNYKEGKVEKIYTLQNIINGKFDSDIIHLAKIIKQYKDPVLFEFAPEPNGDWFSWSGIFNGGATSNKYGDPNIPDGPERYKNAYIHIINIFKQQNVHNITYFFHANAESFPNATWNKPKQYYPGDQYINWIGISIYGALTPQDDWVTFDSILKKTYKDIKAISNKRPFALLEFGVTDFHPQGNKSIWLKNAVDSIINNPYIQFKLVGYWHENWEERDNLFASLRLDSSQSTYTTAHNLFSNEKIYDKFSSQLTFKQNNKNIIIPKQLPQIKDLSYLNYTKQKLSKAQSWYWQLTGHVDIYNKTSVYDIDPSEAGAKIIHNLESQNKLVICYINVGAAENWRNDFKNFPKDVLGNKLEGWQGEYWLNIREFKKFASIIEDRFKLAKKLECQAIEGDNVDGYDNNTGFSLTKQDSINYIKWLSNLAHKNGMLYGLKNSPDIVKQVVDIVDFSIVEECQKYNECNAYLPLVDQSKPVFGVEYIENFDPSNKKSLRRLAPRIRKIKEKFDKYYIIGGVACYELNGCFMRL